MSTMFKYIIVIILIVHGLIHIMGFSKAFGYSEVGQLGNNISKASGLTWLLVALLFALAAIQFILDKELWWIASVIAILASQYLIFSNWQEAKYGSIVNLVILLVTIAGYFAWSFHASYENQTKAAMSETDSAPDLLTIDDLLRLPEPVKKYIIYSGAMNQPKVKNFKLVFKGGIRKDEKSEWMPFTSEQHNFIDSSTRLFFMKATMKYLPVAGFHSFQKGTAFMDIRLFSLFKVQYQTGKEMEIAETVTFFNDMCCMAPATLIDKRIKWLETDGNKVKAEFTNNNISITAWLYFNDRGELINFISNDRYTSYGKNQMEKIPWSTPIKSYKNMRGFKLPGYAETVYHYPEKIMCYGTFELIDVEYNCKN